MDMPTCTQTFQTNMCLGKFQEGVRDTNLSPRVEKPDFVSCLDANMICSEGIWKQISKIEKFPREIDSETREVTHIKQQTSPNTQIQWKELRSNEFILSNSPQGDKEACVTSDKENRQESNGILIKIASWNVRSLNSEERLAQVVRLSPDIALFQEIWDPPERILNLIGEHHSANIRSDTTGGGTLIKWNPNLDVNRQALVINKDSLLMKFILAGNRTFWIASVYIPIKSKKLLIELLAEIQNKVPEVEWPYLIMGGDWNVPLDDENDQVTLTLKNITKQMGLKVIHRGPTRGLKTLDFFVVGNAIRVVDVEKYGSSSDHDLILLTTSIHCPKISLKKVMMPNRKLAEKITIDALKNSKDANSFLKMISKEMKKRKYEINICTKMKCKDHELLKRICQLQEQDEDIRRVIEEFWQEKSEDNEEKRFSSESKEAFSFLRRVYGYHNYEKRDGSIVTKIKDDEGNIITDVKEVSRRLMEELKKFQFKADEPKYTDKLPFPNLCPFSKPQMESIITRLSFNKALALDGVSDLIFKERNLALTCERLNNIWDVDWEKIERHEQHFKARLIPLNKLHPHIPQVNKFRPIIVSSPIVKLLESRISNKLHEYLTNKLHRGQTGFVRGMGTSVNLMRVVDRVIEKLRSKRGARCYGVFVDFQSAYNTVLHRKLYARLEKVLDKEEIDLIKAIYSRNEIHMNGETFKPNVGVSQGSVISPALFNVYIEPLYEEIEKEGVSVLDLLAYADDLLVLCSSPTQVRNVIKTIKHWCENNNQLINLGKSGILEFAPRRGRYHRTWKVGNVIEGFPVVEKYKYLGMWLTPKLELKEQKQHICKKTNFITAKLYPILRRISLSYRINLWKLLAKPLFDQLLFNLYAERSITQINNIETLARTTFRKFTLLTRNVPRRVINSLMDYKVMERAGNMVENALSKWQKRIGAKSNPLIPGLLHKTENERSTKNEEITKEASEEEKLVLPRELVDFLNFQTALCKKCTKSQVCNIEHSNFVHDLNLPGFEETMVVMKDLQVKKTVLVNRNGFNCKEVKLDRKKTLDSCKQFLELHIDSIRNLIVE